MIRISPKKLEGNWANGFALDYHIIKSFYIGDDAYGHPQFETKRTEIGELLYRLKYSRDRSVTDMIVDIAVDFLKKKAWDIDLVIPVPPSRKRIFQPFLDLAEMIAGGLKKPFTMSCLKKVKDIPELKNIYNFDERMNLLSGAFQVDSSEVKHKRVVI